MLCDRKISYLFCILVLVHVVFSFGCESSNVDNVDTTELWPPPGLMAASAPSPECDDDQGLQYYVGPVETSGDGSYEQPFASIQEGLALAQPGDTVYVLPGTYSLTKRISTYRDGTADRRICIRAYDPQDRPVLQRWVGDGQETKEICADSQPLFATEYAGEIFLVRHQYHVIDGFIIDGRYTAEDFSCRYEENELYNARTRAYRVLVAFAHYGVCRSGSSDEFDAYGYNGDHSILRNCDVGHNRVDTINVAADDVLIENCEIHHALRGSFENQTDAHCVSVSHSRNLTLKHVDIHHCSGDCLQVDPDIDNDCGTQQWDQVRIENARLWSSPLVGQHGDWNEGENPGENGVDTKTFIDAQYRQLRPKIDLVNVEAFGFDASGYISTRSVFNVKFRVDWTMDGVTVHDNQYAFRIRGGYENDQQGSAHLRLANVLAYDNDNVARIERYIENLQIFNGTFGNNANLFQHADCPDDICYQTSTYSMQNSLFLGELPIEAQADQSNAAVDASCFVDAGNNDYHLAPTCGSAIDAGVDIPGLTTDIEGNQRQSGSYDIGAFEHVVAE
jgi:hypothetical protein